MFINTDSLVGAGFPFTAGILRISGVTGQPHDGQATAFVETCFPQSGQAISGIEVFDGRR